MTTLPKLYHEDGKIGVLLRPSDHLSFVPIAEMLALKKPEYGANILAEAITKSCNAHHDLVVSVKRLLVENAKMKEELGMPVEGEAWDFAKRALVAAE